MSEAPPAGQADPSPLRWASTAVLVLNWNRRRLTERCIDSVGHQESPWAVYVLNNGCTADERYATESDDRVVVVDSPTDLGFAAGVNLLAGRAIDEGADALILLNNDARLGPRALGELSAALHRGAAVACPMIIDASTGRVSGVGDRSGGAWAGRRVRTEGLARTRSPRTHRQRTSARGHASR